MTCREIENRLLDFEDGQLPASERETVVGHLADCTHCQSFARQLKQLDATLARSVKMPVLSGSFSVKLKERIQATPILTPAEIAERKRRYQAEYEAALAQLRPVPLPSRRVLEGMSYTAVLVTVGLLARQFLPQLVDKLTASGLRVPGLEFLPLLVMSVLFVLMGLIAAFPGRLARLREAAFAR